jgi:cysteine desulfurase/selenocysteine lyase
MVDTDKASIVRPQGAVLDVEAVRRDFPALAQRIHGRPLAYLDSAASAQKPEAVMAAEQRCYREYYSNVHRGVHTLSQRSTEAYEKARSRVARFLGAASDREIVFVRGTTEGINLVAQTWRRRISAGDEILITELEHHSNIVPWQMLCEERGATLRVAPIDDRGQVILEEFHRLLNERTRIAAFAHVSNALGTINPVREMTAAAQAAGAVVLVDGAQAAPHFEIDVEQLGCDFYAFSSHKVYGPTGIGALYGRRELLEQMPPYQGGGEMIRSVTFEKTEYAPPPARFEAGTPHIVGAIGLAAALDYLDGLDRAAVQRHEDDLLRYGTEALSRIPGVRLIGTAEHRAAVLSFIFDGVHAHDVGTILDLEGIAVRVGHHCAQPVMQHFGLPATVRASLALYNRRDEIDRLAVGLLKVREVFP